MALSKDTLARLVIALADQKSGDEIEDLLEELAESADSVASGHYESRFIEHSVNQSKTKIGVGGTDLVLSADKKHTGAVAGNLNGGGSGNKPIVGIRAFQKYVGMKFSDIDLVISQDTEIRTVDDADEQRLGVSYNMLVDVEGLGNPADWRVFDFTNTLGGAVDKYAETGASASVDDFNIKTDDFYVVLGLDGLNSPSWFSNIVTWNDVVTGYPNATIISEISTDNGHPAGEKLAALQAQIGGSGNALRALTVITRLEINGEKIV